MKLLQTFMVNQHKLSLYHRYIILAGTAIKNSCATVPLFAEGLGQRLWVEKETFLRAIG